MEKKAPPSQSSLAGTGGVRPIGQVPVGVRKINPPSTIANTTSFTPSHQASVNIIKPKTIQIATFGKRPAPVSTPTSIPALNTNLNTNPTPSTQKPAFIITKVDDEKETKKSNELSVDEKQRKLAHKTGEPLTRTVRTAAGETWNDPTLAEWDSNDFRIFVGDLGSEVTDVMLHQAFSKYPSLAKARVVADRRSGKSKGYGFVSFKEPQDFLVAIREMNGKYIGNRPIKLRKSTWADRSADPSQLKRSKNK